MTWIDNHLPSWVDRERWQEHQLGIHEEVCRAWDEGNRLVVLDDPPGGGKSLLGYMSYRHVGGDAYYLVGTKYLQSQIERTLPDVAIIKGRRNYTPTHLDSSIHGPDVKCDDCDKDENGCSLCLNADLCPYLLARDDAEQSSLTCANYKYALGEWTSPKSKFRHRDLVICDEADTLVKELQDFVSVSVSRGLQKRFSIRPPAKKTVEESWPAWFDYAIPKLTAIRKQTPNNSIPNRRLRSRLERLLSKMEAVTEDFDGWVYDYAPRYELGEQDITFKPVAVDKVAGDSLWRHGSRYLCMSASMGSPEQFVRDLGYTGDWTSVMAPSTFDVAHRPIYFFPAALMTYKTEVAETPKMAMGVRAVLEEYPKARVLVLPHTYKLATTLYEGLVGELPRDLFIYRNSDEREEVVRLFGECDQSNAPVLFAPSLGRGYDNRDIDLVIICKTPFPFLGSKQVSKRHRMSDGEVWLANETVKELVQNYGRIMRSEDDSGITIIADARFSKFYGEWKRYFPEWFVDAYEQESDVRFDLTRAMRKMARM